MTALVCDAEPNYTYQIAPNTNNGIPIITDLSKAPKTGGFYYQGTYFYDTSAADARYKQIKDDYIKSHTISETVGYNEDGSTYPIVNMNCFDGLAEIRAEYMNSPEYKALPKED